MRLLSIVIPAYNEDRTLGQVLQRIPAVDTASAGFDKEVIVVDDGSTDRTLAIAESFAPQGIRCFSQRHQGKGRAVHLGIEKARGEYVMIQDADLEYDPQDYLPMLRALNRGDVVYGSRTLGQYNLNGSSMTPGKHPKQGLGPWLAGVILTYWTLLLYGRYITDTLTCYKLYPVSRLRQMKVRTSGFETDHEITAHLIRGGARIVEVPISYAPRTVSEGKKIGAWDGFVAFWTLLRFRWRK